LGKERRGAEDVEGGYSLKQKTPSIFRAEDRGRLTRLTVGRSQVAQQQEQQLSSASAKDPNSAFDATRPFPERKWSLHPSDKQARFPDFRLKRTASRPSQPLLGKDQ
jgi:hypothetical protein